MEDYHSTVASDYEILHEKYQTIKKLQKTGKNIKEECEIVNESEDVNRLIDEAIKKINDILTNENDGQKIRLLAMRATLLYERSKLLSSSNNDEEAKEILAKCLDDINDYNTKPEIIYLTLRIINHYAYLLSKCEDYSKSQKILELSESIYRTVKKELSTIIFFTSDNLFSSSIINKSTCEFSNKLERLVTNNLQMLAFVYNKQELHDKFADYHHEVLARQIQMHDDDLLMWSIKATTLASYLLGKNRFFEARHHLAAAIHVLYDYEKQLQAAEPSQDINEKWQKLRKQFADTANAWVKYGFTLFNQSKKKTVENLCENSSQALEKLWISPFNSSYLNTTEQIDEKIVNKLENIIPLINKEENKLTMPLSSIAEVEEQNCMEKKLIFTSLNLYDYESQVAVTLVENTAQARALFHHTHAWLKKVKLFYTLQEYPMEYVNAILDLSELYKYLAFYEEDIESQYAVQKLRADALETLSTILREIRPQCYIAVSVELLRELAEIQLEMMGLNLRRIYAAQGVAPEKCQSTIIHKIDALTSLHTKLQQFNNVQNL